MAQSQAQDSENSAVSGKAGKDLVNKDGSVTQLIEWATQNISSPEEMLDFFEQSGVAVTRGEEITGDYKVVRGDEKAEWCAKHEGTRLFVVQWHFYENSAADENGNRGEFAAIHLVSPAGKFILNDSAKGGMYGTLRKITDAREEKDPESAVTRSSMAGLMVAGGLRRNKPFQYDTRTRKTIPKLELNDVKLHPMEFREESRPTWDFNL
jgi:hypothetical protein